MVDLVGSRFVNRVKALEYWCCFGISFSLGDFSLFLLFDYFLAILGIFCALYLTLIVFDSRFLYIIFATKKVCTILSLFCF